MSHVTLPFQEKTLIGKNEYRIISKGLEITKPESQFNIFAQIMTSIFWSQSIILKPHCLNKNEWFIILHSMQNSDILHKNLWFGSSHFAKFLCKQPYEIFFAITKYFLAFVLDIFDFRFPLQKCKKKPLAWLEKPTYLSEK